MSKKPVSLDLSRRDFLTKTSASLTAPILASSLPTIANAKAPFLGTSKPQFYRIKVGDFEITSISDGEAMIDKVHPIFGANTTKEDVDSVLNNNLMPTNLFNPSFTPTIINTGEKIILFDTGNGDDGFAPRPLAGRLTRQLESAGFTPEQIDIVVLTHGHSDHIGGMKEKDQEVFPNAEYVISAIEFDFWNNLEDIPKGLEGFSRTFIANTKGLKEKFRFIKPGQDVVTGVQAVEAYGHAPGHLGFHIESKGKQFLIWGDCAHHHVLSLARPDLHFFFDWDKEIAAQTRKKIFDMVATDKLAVIGYHMPFPAFGFVEKRDNQGYRWIPNSIQLK